MFRSAFMIGLLAAGLVGGSGARAASSAEEDHTRTCAYFAKRVWAHDRGDRAEWLALLSESCAAALRERSATNRRDGEPDARGEVYLERLGDLRRIVVGMNVARFTGARTAPGRSASRSTVTASGEYLIARHLGVMDALFDWARATEFATAALPGGGAAGSVE